jgi:uncharacterized protein with GYD domain
MATYILLVNWTDQGIKAIKDSPKRLDAGRVLAKKFGCEIKDFYLTFGAYDMISVVEAPDDEVVAKYLLSLGSGGNLRTMTLKAFAETSYREIIGSLKRT